ncbi:hypothetical protein [Winogradskyella flava]|uniref:Uncharacterized protein n=1 Tax=Winogradskyella flava TaxID=1884876 RepID=A0A842IQS7_9FLAO|nr:hypothetical protein [Winogradskyella flava]MBC2845075.1 hypothetical protein [Winogradskyella flava]
MKIFYKLSIELVDIKDLKLEVSNYYFELLLNEYGDDFISLLNNNYFGKKAKSTSSERKLNGLIIYLWYTSEFITRSELDSFFDVSDDFNKQNEFVHSSPVPYYNGLVWKAIRAHPLGLTGGYFGYWKYKPEN